MDDKKTTALEMAFIFAGGIKCRCGNEMRIKQRKEFGADETQFYLLCEKCQKHTKVYRVGSYEPVAKYIDFIKKIQVEI